MRRTRPSRDDALRAALTLASAVLAFCATYAVCLRAGSGAQPAILAAILSLGLSRRTRSAHDVPLLVLPLVLAGVALAASGVGWLFVHLPVAGAAVFVAGLFLSIWLRNFGANARRAGALLALPLVAMLIVPPPDLSAPGGAATALALTILAGIIAPLSAAIVRRLGAFIGLHPAAEAATAPNEARSATAGLTVPTRMALQMAVALTLAFVVGFGASDQALIAGIGKARACVVGKFSDDPAFTSIDDHVGDGLRQICPAGDGEKMFLSLGLGDFDERTGRKNA